MTPATSPLHPSAAPAATSPTAANPAAAAASAPPPATAVGSELRLVSFLARSAMSWQVWKETQPDLFWFFERNFGASAFRMRLTSEEKAYIIEFEAPNDVIGKLEKAFKDGTLATEVDKVHGTDPILGKKDVKLSHLSVTLGETRPQNQQTRQTIESLEEQLILLEQMERARSIDLKTVMEQLQACQLDFHKRFELLDKKVDDVAAKLDTKCERLERSMARLRK
ncbi:hypothetical protein DFJ73DRAFT_653859 [Zopfochytrium polystomum]|nr:hypothetical protein DFJ73DRAFT_653859 [Zopfochytrium polystomum]